MRARLAAPSGVACRLDADDADVAAGAMPRAIASLADRCPPRLAVGDSRGGVAVRRIDAADLAAPCVARLPHAHAGRAVAALISQNSALLSAGDDGWLRFWHFDSSGPTLECAVPVAGASIADVDWSRFCDADALVVSLVGELSLVDRRMGAVFNTVPIAGAHAARFVEERLLLVSSRRDAGVSVFDCRDLSQPVAVVVEPPLQDTALFGWGAALLRADSPPPPAAPEPLFRWRCDGAPARRKTLDVASRRYVDTFAGHSACATVLLHASSRGSLLATTQRGDHALKLWSLEPDTVGTGVASCSAPHAVHCAAFAPDDRHVVGGLADGSLALWRSDPGGGGAVREPLLREGAHSAPVRAVVFCGEHAVASIGADGVRVHFGVTRL